MSVLDDEPRGELDESDPIGRFLILKMREASELVAPGVLAHVIERRKWVEVRGVMCALPRKPGAVGRWLDSLPTDRKVVVPAVVSDRLAGMLTRRGFTAVVWWDDTLLLPDAGAMVREAQL